MNYDALKTISTRNFELKINQFSHYQKRIILAQRLDEFLSQVSKFKATLKLNQVIDAYNEKSNIKFHFYFRCWKNFDDQFNFYSNDIKGVSIFFDSAKSIQSIISAWQKKREQYFHKDKVEIYTGYIERGIKETFSDFENSDEAIERISQVISHLEKYQIELRELKSKVEAIQWND